MSDHRFFQVWPTENKVTEYHITNCADNDERLNYFVETSQEDTFGVREIGDGRLEFITPQCEGLMIRNVTPEQGIILFYNMLAEREVAAGS